MFFIKKILKDIARWIFWYPIRIVIQKTPFSFAFALANIMGYGSYLFSKSKRMIMNNELDVIFSDTLSDQQKDKIIKDAFVLMAKEKIETLNFPRLNKENILKISDIEGEEKLEAALHHQRGIVVLLSHFGQNRMIMPILGYRDYKINQIAAPVTLFADIVDKRLVSPLMQKTLNLELEYEKTFPAKFIYYDTSLRQAFIALKNNEIVVIAVDGGGGENRIPVEFLSRKALLPTGAFKLAHKTAAVALPMFVRRNKDNTHTLIIKDEIKIDLKAGESNFKNELQDFANILEKEIKEYPEHYLKHLLMIHQRSDIEENAIFVD